jgi:ketosteroid isomerase-like protein
VKSLATLGLMALPLLPSSAFAQEWTPEQQEVWDFELGCQESKEAWIDCFHEDYVAWADMSLGVPARKADNVAIGGRSWDDNEQLFVHLTPVEITVKGDFAVALVVYTNTVRNRATGEVVTTTQAWTDVLIKDGGRWYWIADHGSPVGTP